MSSDISEVIVIFFRSFTNQQDENKPCKIIEIFSEFSEEMQSNDFHKKGKIFIKIKGDEFTPNNRTIQIQFLIYFRNHPITLKIYFQKSVSGYRNIRSRGFQI